MMNFPEKSTLSPVSVPVQSILVHYGEIALKGRNRRLFEEQLVTNISSSLDGTGKFSVRRLPGRISIHYADGIIPESSLEKLQRVFGVSNIALALWLASDIEEIKKGVASLIDGKNFESFAIRTRRSDKSFPLPSPEVNREVGAFVEKYSGARVDLDTPQYAIDIEILSRNTFLFSERFPGPGGLPVGTAGKVACLLSGGIDSPVASWRMMKRGCFPFYIHFHSAPFLSGASVEKVIDLAELLSRGIPGVKLFVVPFGEIQKSIVMSTPEEFRILLYRRLMVRIAESIAKRQGAKALVTGESLAQVASQTLSNLAAIEAVATLPLLRPLIGMDKQEIVNEAKRIGTFEISVIPHDDCCSFLVPTHPATKSIPEKLTEIESQIDVHALIQKACAEVSERNIS